MVVPGGRRRVGGCRSGKARRRSFSSLGLRSVAQASRVGTQEPSLGLSFLSREDTELFPPRSVSGWSSLKTEPPRTDGEPLPGITH